MNQQINLYTAEFRPDSNAFQSMFMFQAVGILMLALLVIYAFARHEVAQVDDEIRIVEKLEAAAIERLQAVGPLIAALTGEQSWLEQLESAERMLAQRQAVLNLVQGTSLGNTDGFSAQLRALSRQDVDGIWLTHIVLSGQGDRTRLEGRAFRPELIPVYVQDLTSEPAFASQRFHRFEIDNPMDDGGSEMRFSMHSEVLRSPAARGGR
ncbi:MAG: hypothetical protein R3288_13575 [Woeseiaceae bacterium]|nr:hypothetical protein [Woeseiaceae bacterium]